MEMENSRSSIDRSRESGLKKPRLINNEADRDHRTSSNGVRLFPPHQRLPAALPTAPVLSRVTTIEAERNDSNRDVQLLQQQQQQQSNQEIVSEYKTALAELTFNSKPIITNLTIIAGENLHSAKWISSAICANIIEVATEQKLPSLYLLDSIVKNIGRDYIKYFAGRLPEVFCKAYRQVDASLHSGMQHLFGTWKGVFPPACLQMIEKELAFTPAINVSSSGASRADSQSHRPVNSIHVNPKYLEARQRLQQSSRAKVDDNNGAVVASADDAVIPDRAAIIGRGRPWADLAAKHDIRHPQKEVLSEAVHEKKTSVVYEENQYGADFTRNSDLKIGKSSERVAERVLGKSRYAAGTNTVDATISQTNAFNSDYVFPNHRTPKYSQAIAQLQPTLSTANRNGGEMPRIWKNFEEEEYIWDEMNSRLRDYGGPDSSRKDGWTPNDAEKPEFQNNQSQPHSEHGIGLRSKRETSSDSLSMARRRQAGSGHQTSSMWPLQEPNSTNGSNHKDIPARYLGLSDGNSTFLSGLTSITSSTARTGVQNPIGPSVGAMSTSWSLKSTVVESGSAFGQQRQQPLRFKSPSGQSSMHLRPHSPIPSALHQHQESPPSLTEYDQSQIQSVPAKKASQLTGQLNRASHKQANQDSFPILPQNDIHPSQNLQLIQSQPSQNRQASYPSVPFPQLGKNITFSKKPHQDLIQSQPSSQIQKPLPHSSILGPPIPMGTFDLSHSSNTSGDISGQLSSGTLVAAIMKSGLLSDNSVTHFQDSHSNIQPPLSSGRLPTQSAASSSPIVPPASVLDPASHGSASSRSLTTPPKNTSPPPLPPGPPPASIIGSTSIETSNPLSSILTTLVVKGLISAPVKNSPNLMSTQVPSQLPDQSSSIATSTSMPVSSLPASSIFPSSGNELRSRESTAKGITTLSQAMTPKTKDLIGFEFKPDIIRESHPSVISDLFDDLPHRCDICGLRLKLRELLERHLVWHSSKMPEAGICNSISRRWYVSLADWVTGTAGSSSGPSSIILQRSVETAENSEPAVPGDESQSVCLLCGELFEDFYSFERDIWMFKGAVCMPIPTLKDKKGTMEESSAKGLFVHASCISPSSVSDLGLAKNVELDQMYE